MKALFGRKICCLKKLEELTESAIKKGQKGQSYTITKEVFLEDEDFREFSLDFLEDQSWITRDDGGLNLNGELCCIRVININTGQKVLVNSSGYDYPRYTGLEIE